MPYKAERQTFYGHYEFYVASFHKFPAWPLGVTGNSMIYRDAKVIGICVSRNAKYCYPNAA
jgi:hypothetical protein